MNLNKLSRKDQKVIELPTSRDCPSIEVGCYISKAHRHLSDSIEYLEEAVARLMRPEQKEIWVHNEEGRQNACEMVALLDNLKAQRDRTIDTLCYMGTDCDHVIKCKKC
jgi:hypothetical protein